MSDSRYPYTYACDLIRAYVGAGVSRSDASLLRGVIAEATGIGDAALAACLADYYLRKRSAIDEMCLRRAAETFPGLKERMAKAQEETLALARLKGDE